MTSPTERPAPPRRVVLKAPGALSTPQPSSPRPEAPGRSTDSQSGAGTAQARSLIKIASPKGVGGPDCVRCPLDKAPLAHPKMPPTGAAEPIFYFIGEGPGKNEDLEGVQFVGESGQLLRNYLPVKWAPHIRWNNTVRCRTSVDNRDPSPIELECCTPLQVADIERTRPAILVGFGAVPLNWALREAGEDHKIGAWRGRRMPLRVGTHVCWFYPLYHPAALLYWKHKAYNKFHAYLRTFERDLQRVFSDYESGLPPPVVESPTDYRTGITSVAQFDAAAVQQVQHWLERMAAHPDSTLDLETNALRPYGMGATPSRILSCAVGIYEDTIAFPLEHPEARWTPPQLAALYTALERYLRAPGRKWAHYAKFEQEWLAARYGEWVLQEVAWGDTAALAHTLDERPGKALGALTQIWFGFDVKAVTKLNRRGLAAEPLSVVLPYNGMDTKYTDALRRLLSAELDAARLRPVYEEINSTTPSLVGMQMRGLERNLPALQHFTKDLGAQQQRVLTAIQTNPDVSRFREVRGKFLPTSNPDLVAFFRDFLKLPHPDGDQAKKTTVSGYSLSEEVLARMSHPVAGAVLELRSLNKRLGTYVDPLITAAERAAWRLEPLPKSDKHVHHDGRLHPTYSNLVTSTGRLQSAEPNAQNFPYREHPEIRRVIAAPPGHWMVSYDYGQLEARVIAMASRDPTLVRESCEDYDIHGDWTDQLGRAFDPAALRTPETRKHLREYIKNKWTFPLFYGSSLESVAVDLSEVFGSPIKSRADLDTWFTRLKPFFDAFWAKYPGVLAWQRSLEAQYWRRGYVETLVGLRRREPLSYTELINSPIQGTAAQIVIDAQRRIARLAYERAAPQLHPVLNVHDDLTFYLPEATLEQDIETIARAMCLAPYAFVNVPLVVEVALGRNWADQEDLATFRTTDFGWQPPQTV